ncbi:uncharacterized protein LOC144348256, partial [Saccoglossus kowalevskii]
MERQLCACMLIVIVTVINAKPIDDSVNESVINDRIIKVSQLYEDAGSVMESISLFLGTLSELDPQSTEVARSKSASILPEKRGSGPGFQTGSWRRRRSTESAVNSLAILRSLDQQSEQMTANIYDFLDSLDN